MSGLLEYLVKERRVELYEKNILHKRQSSNKKKEEK
jgi:hypothetical protein